MLSGVLVMTMLGHHDADGDDAFLAPFPVSPVLIAVWQDMSVEPTESQDALVPSVTPPGQIAPPGNDASPSTEVHLAALACAIAFVVVGGALVVGRLAQHRGQDASALLDRLSPAGAWVVEMSPARYRAALCVLRI